MLSPPNIGLTLAELELPGDSCQIKSVGENAIVQHRYASFFCFGELDNVFVLKLVLLFLEEHHISLTKISHDLLTQI